MAWFLNHYRCEACGAEWQDEWSAMSDDDCPHCGARHMEPHESTDLTEIITADDRGVLVLRSLDSAEHTPDYRILVEFSSREEAKRFLHRHRSAR